MNALEIRGLTKRYKDFALEGLDLTLPGGCVMGLVGENGAGKSTTIKLILDMIKRDAGTITVLGHDNREDTRGMKEQLGVVLDEVGISACLTPAQVGKIMRNVYASWDAEEYERLLDRLSLPRQKQFGDFSRGMKMKLGIAVALAHHPRLLILDEATSGLDPVVRDEVLELFRDFVCDGEHSILISSHIVSDLEKLCDYIAFLHKGRLLLCEEKDRLYEKYGILRCSNEDLRSIEPSAVVGLRKYAYGVEAIVERDAVPQGLSLGSVDIEQLFIVMVKEEK